ncbi:MAG: FecR domain-containing protein [Cyclobacteriaceae bacterium]
MNDQNHSEETLLIAKHLSGETTNVEEEALQKWIALSAANEQIYSKLKRIYEVSGKLYGPAKDDSINIDVEKEWNHFENKVESKGKTIQLEPQRTGPIWLRIAAVVLLVIVSGIVVNYFIGKSGEQFYQTAENTEEIILPDGSAVFLNRNSTLTVRNSYNAKSREVELLGEAFFEVTPDAQRPFIIEVDNAEVRVLGTSFNVRNLDRDKEVDVVVETGVVQLKSKNIEKSIELTAGQRGTFNKKEKQLLSIENTDANFLSWKTKTMVFNNANLKSVVETLQATYGIEIIISTDVSVECEVTVTFENQPLEAVLKVLQSTLNLTYKREKNRIEITGAGC